MENGKGVLSRIPSRYDKLPDCFELGESLGRGAYGEVLKATNKNDKKEYAIKIVPFDAKKESADKYMREVRNLADLHHTNVVRYHNSWTETHEIPIGEYKDMDLDSEESSDSKHSLKNDSEEVTFQSSSSRNSSTNDGLKKEINLLIIQLELCCNNLRHEIDNGLHQNEPKLQQYFHEICKGLAYIHEQNIIHRDLKPENILIHISGSAKIGDFNLSRQMLNENCKKNVLCSHESLTNSCGTNIYIAPEVKQNNKYNQKADMYSLGVILFEMSSRAMTSHEKSEIFPLHVTLNWTALSFHENPAQKEDLIRNLLEPDSQKRLSSSNLIEKLQETNTRSRAEAEQLMKYEGINRPQVQIYKSALKSHNNFIYQTNKFLNIAVEVFERHNGQNISMLLIQPERRPEENSVCLLNERGHVVSLSSDSRIPFCEYLKLHNLSKIRRYAVGKKFKHDDLLPEEIQECTFDVVTPIKCDFTIEAELFYIVQSIIDKQFCDGNSVDVEFYVNHGLIFEQIMGKYLPSHRFSEFIQVSIDAWNNVNTAVNKDGLRQYFTRLGLSAHISRKLKPFLQPKPITAFKGLAYIVVHRKFQVREGKKKPEPSENCVLAQHMCLLQTTPE